MSFLRQKSWDVIYDPPGSNILRRPSFNDGLLNN